MSPPSPSKGASKTQNGRFPLKNALRLKKVCYKVSLSENCQRQSCKAFIGLPNRGKIIGGGDPLYLKFWIKVTALVRNRRFSIYFRSLRLNRNTCVKTVDTKLQGKFIGLTIRAKMIGGELPLLHEILSQSDRVAAKFEQ